MVFNGGIKFYYSHWSMAIWYAIKKIQGKPFFFFLHAFNLLELGVNEHPSPIFYAIFKVINFQLDFNSIFHHNSFYLTFSAKN